MEMLVTKFSKGKYRNESDLFAEPISSQNVKLMGEMIALQALRTVKKFDMKIADKLYIGLIKDLHHMSEIDYIVSDGYDVAQTAICFLYQFKGRNVHEIYGKDCKGKDISIKLACYREVDHFISLLRNRPDRNGKTERSNTLTSRIIKLSLWIPSTALNRNRQIIRNTMNLSAHCNYPRWNLLS